MLTRTSMLVLAGIAVSAVATIATPNDVTELAPTIFHANDLGSAVMFRSSEDAVRSVRYFRTER